MLFRSAAGMAADRSIPPGTTPTQAALDRAAAEEAERGDFDRVFPAGDTADLLRCFVFPRQSDLALGAPLLKTPAPLQDPALVPAVGVALQHLHGGALELTTTDGSAYALNPVAGYIWQAYSGGADVTTITADLAAAFPDAQRDFAWDVRSLLADWAANGVLIDATVVRGLLLPASLALLGDRSWR